ncbi:MAG: DUF373 family protein [bacterium]
MKTLILCVDRDDDLGTKAGAVTPLVGRRRNLEAAVALGLADPEDSDTNALFAAIHLYDKELAATQGGGNPVEVACVAGHRSLGLQADRKISAELEEVLAAVRPDQVILVSDGAEDEQILPLLHSRAKVVHVHRSVVKQAPRLEGFYYVITRLLDDEKQAKRFVLPFAIVLLIWGIAYILGIQAYAWGATLAILGSWLIVHAMKWETKFGRFFHDLAEAAKGGWLSLFANLFMVFIFVLGLRQGYVASEEHRAPLGSVVHHPILLKGAVFMQEFWWYLVSGVLVQTAGGLMNAILRTGRVGMGRGLAAFTLIAMGFLGSVASDVAVGTLQGSSIIKIMDPTRYMELVTGLLLAAGLIMVHRYVRSFQRSPQPAR